MRFKEGNLTHGFTVTRIREVEELKGTLYEMEHIKSGAKLVWLENQEENKLFSIAFKTLPSDDTGVFHILEHSVLCGSEKYTAKEPFVELLKSSMQTFLNAMTFPDKTLYPISSRNQKDFENLMNVYLDAVFKPAIYENPNIFYQEGWHYEMHGKEEIPEYKGVVFNEMKGAFSSVDHLLTAGMKKLLFPDNCYSFESGGNPEAITDLSYEEFIAAHKTFYHPSNSRIYLDGNLDIDSALGMIDEQYLSQYDRQNSMHEIPLQMPTASGEQTVYYEIPEDEEKTEKTQISIGQIISTWEDRKKIMATQILGDYLAASNDAPLKKEILRLGLAQDFDIQVYDGIQQPFMFFTLHNVNYENKQQIVEMISDTLEEIKTTGLNSEELEAIMNQFEFQIRESSEPKGLMRNIMALNSWQFEGDPLQYLTCNEIFAELRQGIKDGYFEQVFEEVFWDLTKKAFVYALPSKTIGEEMRKAEEEKLIKKKAEFSPEELEEILSINQKLDLWQQTPDQKEDIDTLPKLELNEVDVNPEEKITEISEIKSVKVLYHPSSVSGIIYMNMYFELGEVEESMLPGFGRAIGMLEELPTKNYTVAELQRAVKKYIGSIDYNLDTYSTPGETEKCGVRIVVNCSVLSENFANAAELIREILLETKWEEHEKIHELFIQKDQMLQQSIIMNGHMYAIKRVTSHFSAENYVKEMIDGFHFYQWQHDFLQNFDKQIDQYIAAVKKILSETVCQKHMTISITSIDKNIDLAGIISGYKKGNDVCKNTYRKPQMEAASFKEAISIPAGISYAVLGMNLSELVLKYPGEIRVLSKILSLNYLWNAVRVQGGAYGAGFSAGETGNVIFYSYRDPDAAGSISVYKKAFEYVKIFCDSEEEIDKFIIASIADIEPLRSAMDYGRVCDNDYFRNITKADREIEKKQMLEMTKKDLLKYCNIIEEIGQQGAICVIGHAEAIKDLDAGYKKMSL